MKLAEALQERADLTRKTEQLKQRLNASCLVQEGESPAEDPKLLFAELDSAVARLAELAARINKTNCETYCGESTLTQLIARKDALKTKHAILSSVIATAGQNTQRARYSEIKILPTVKVSALQKQSDDIAKEIRLLDNTLQECNWLNELK